MTSATSIHNANELHERIKTVTYPIIDPYKPQKFALMLLNFIKMVHEGNPTENKTPPMHLKMMDKFVGDNPFCINVCFRGSAKTTLEHYLILFLAVFGKFPGEPLIYYGLYVADSIENNVKKMRLALEATYRSSAFLQEAIPTMKLTDVRWYFQNADGKEIVFTGHGAVTGVRGTKELNTRPQLALFDDLMTDEAAKSPTQLEKIKDTIYNAVLPAMHPTYKRVIWNGTPFNMADPLSIAIASGSWDVNVFPVCEKFPCEEHEFKGAWGDRFTWKSLMQIYKLMKDNGKVDAFYQEYMLQVVSDEDRLVNLEMIQWYNRQLFLSNRENYNFYITTDLATSEGELSDDSVIYVWAIDNHGNWYWVDGLNKPQEMDKNLDDMFAYVQIYKPIEVGLEVSGQQKGFIPWIKQQMQIRNIYFTLARDEGSKKEGLSPKGRSKLSRFNVVAPWFNAGLMHFPEEMRSTPEIEQMMHQLSLVTHGGIKSKKDDCIDGISQLGSLRPWKPAATTEGLEQYGTLSLDDIIDDMDSYLV